MSKKDLGFVKINRNFLNDPIYNNGRAFNLKEVLLDLTIRAFYTDTSKLYLNKMRYYQRGQVEGSVRQFADWWCMSKDTAALRLEQLREAGYIYVDSSNTQTVVTLRKYCIEQDKTGLGADTNSDSNDTNSLAKPVDEPVDTDYDNFNKEKESIKKDKRKSKKEKTFDFEDY